MFNWIWILSSFHRNLRKYTHTFKSSPTVSVYSVGSIICLSSLEAKKFYFLKCTCICIFSSIKHVEHILCMCIHISLRDIKISYVSKWLFLCMRRRFMCLYVFYTYTIKLRNSFMHTYTKLHTKKCMYKIEKISNITNSSFFRKTRFSHLKPNRNFEDAQKIMYIWMRNKIDSQSFSFEIVLFCTFCTFCTQASA